MNSSKKYESFIFTHIPKCAGTSFRNYIHKVGLANGIEEAQMHVPGSGALGNDKNISQLTDEELMLFRASKKRILADHSLFNAHKEYNLNMETPYYYVILREPMERFFSHYNFFYRHLDYWGLKNVHLNDLKKETLIELLSRMANVQLFYCMNARYLSTNPMTPLKKMKRYGRQFVRTISFKKLYNPLPWGLKADASWLKEGVKNLTENYGSFGIVEKMEASLKLLDETSPDWLSFSKTPFPVKNKGVEFSEDEPVNEETLDVIRHYNYYDLKFYEQALKLFERQFDGHR